MERHLAIGMVFFLAFGGFACGSSDNGNGDPEKIEDLPLDGEVQLIGLDGPVEVVTDARGMPHIYASTEHDAIMVQGYLMARDRMAQFEFFRRSLQGTITEIISPALLPSLLDQDIGARQSGFHRMAKDIRATLQDGDPTLEVLEAFSEGVNLHIAELKAGTVNLPGSLGGVLPVNQMADWTPTDTLCIARYMVYDLSKSAYDDLEFTEDMVAIAEEFPANDPDPKIAARAGMLHDLMPFEPAEHVWTRDGFPNLESDSGSRAFWNPAKPMPAPRPPRLPSRETLSRARQYFDKLESISQVMKGPGGGSNNWAVHGSKTATGNPMMMSDPHLSLDSPGFFWYAHMNTKRAGGDLNVSGLALFGAPGILLGYNDNVAWGLTVANYDVDDVYLEEITPGVGGAPDTVLYKGNQVPIEIIEEQINITGQDPVSVEIEWVPHHGLILPGTHQPGGTEAISRRWAGYDPSSELEAVMGMNKASSVEEVEDALDAFKVGAQNWMVALSSGDIYWSSSSRIPQRDPRAMSYDPATQTGYAPFMVLPGNGDYEWLDDLSDRYIPHDLNPAKGYICTANQDQVGVTADGNPFNDPYYLSWDFDLGHRLARIDTVLNDLTTRGDVTREEMSALQGENRSPLGAKFAASFVAAVDRAQEEKTSAGTHPDLTTVVAEMGADFDDIVAMRDRLAAWTSFLTPAAVEGDPTAEEIADSVAASIFNASITRLAHLAFDDEITRMGNRPWDNRIARTLQWAMLEPSKLATYDDTIGDTLLWDDLDTVDVDETRDERILRAMMGANEFLTGKLGANMDQWRWGKLHTVRFEDITGLFGAEFSIPPEGDAQFPDGFPRHGDLFVVDASHYGLWNTTDFSYGSGPQQRVVVEMTPDGPNIWNAHPGGQSHYPDDPHFSDDAELWRKNEAPPLFFHEIDVVKNAEKRIRYIP